MDVTVLGARGFIGSHLATELRRRGHPVSAPDRDANLAGVDLGTVFYCIGLTADFRSRPFDTVTAHVSALQQVLQHCRFERLVYLSSTRLYSGAGISTAEEQPLRVNPADPSDLYNLSKAMGESLALHSGRPVRIARLANVYGDDWDSDNFLPSLLKAALRDGRVTLRTSSQSAKDYVHLNDAIDLLIHIGTEGRERMYNVASGRNVTNGELLDRLREVTGCAAEVASGVPTIAFPSINVERVRSEFGFSPTCVLRELPRLVETYQRHREDWR